jgi:hypothetical protein
MIHIALVGELMMPRSLASLPLRLVGRRNVATLVLRAVASTPPSDTARVAAVRRFHASSYDDGKPSSKTEKITHSTFLESIDLTNPGADDRRKLSKLIQEVVHTKANAGGTRGLSSADVGWFLAHCWMCRLCAACRHRQSLYQVPDV